MRSHFPMRNNATISPYKPIASKTVITMVR
jgi:hypothetical protein